MKRSGKRSSAQTPSPKKDRVFGSNLNKTKSASSKSSSKSIVFGERLTNTIKDKIQLYNQKNPEKKVTLNVAKAVVRRGLGAFSISHRPNMTRTQWGLARLNTFLKKKKGEKVKKSYIQDDDLM